MIDDELNLLFLVIYIIFLLEKLWKLCLQLTTTTFYWQWRNTFERTCKNKMDPVEEFEGVYNKAQQQSRTSWNKRRLFSRTMLELAWNHYKTDSMFSHHSWSSRLYINLVLLTWLWLLSFPRLSRFTLDENISVGVMYPSLFLMYFLKSLRKHSQVVV